MSTVNSNLKNLIRAGTTHGLDFVSLEELRKRTGISPSRVLMWSLGEMLCNALDKADASIINIEVTRAGEFDVLTISDNGSQKLKLKDIKLIVDFQNKASSKRGFQRVSRGYLGNALKCILGYSYALAESKNVKPQDVQVKSGSYEYTIRLKPDLVKEIIQSEIQTSKRTDDGYTAFIVKIPSEGTDLCEIKDLIFASSMVNPNRLINYSLFNGDIGALGLEDRQKPLRNETSVLWYFPEQFSSLYYDFAKEGSIVKLIDFISLFRGFTAKKIIREILQELNAAVNHDSQSVYLQFFPSIPIKDLTKEAVLELYRVMRSKAKPVSWRSIPQVLGSVGEAAFEKLRQRYEWKRLRYTTLKDIRIEQSGMESVRFPFLIELAIFDRENDGEGLKVYQCINFMASMEDVFSRIFDISYRLGRVGITRETPVTVVAHLVCPVLKWLNYGKSGIDE